MNIRWRHILWVVGIVLFVSAIMDRANLLTHHMGTICPSRPAVDFVRPRGSPFELRVEVVFPTPQRAGFLATFEGVEVPGMAATELRVGEGLDVYAHRNAEGNEVVQLVFSRSIYTAFLGAMAESPEPVRFVVIMADDTWPCGEVTVIYSYRSLWDHYRRPRPGYYSKCN